MKTTLIPAFFLITLGTMAQNKTKIMLTEQTYDFGTVLVGNNCSHQFTFTNIGNLPLIFDRVTTSCGCDVPSYPKEPFAPGQSGMLGYYYDSKRIGPINKTMTVFGNFDGSPLVIRIRGNIVQEYELPEITVWPKNYFKPFDNATPVEKNLLQIEDPE
ncbi:MAG TPA: DUF1573 domain-containing protein [Flavobacteriales bacterium]|nr:DUF1573 domain-containing protein [Flavobacteriales bacterium]